MQTIRGFVGQLDYDECLQIMKDYEQFEKDGYIGDCLLREKSGIVKAAYGSDSIVLIMEALIKEVYRRLAYGYTRMVYLSNKTV